MQTLSIGAHLSRTRAHGYVHAFQAAERIGANVIQLFAGSPRQFTRVYDNVQADPVQLADLQAARAYTTATATPTTPATTIPPTTTDPPNHPHARVRLFFHAPYVINLSNPDPVKMRAHADFLHQELEVCELAGGEGVVVHTGKRKVKEGQSDEGAYTTFVRTVQMALERFHAATTPTKPSTPQPRKRARILIETSAGAGNSIGVSLSDFARLYLDSGFTAAEREHRVGIVIDTCHVYGAGYDIASHLHARQFLHTFHHLCRIPPSHVKLIHLNDSKGKLGSLTDYHEHLGDGWLFANAQYEGLGELMRAYVPLGVPFVLETHDPEPYGAYAKEIGVCRGVWEGVVGDQGVGERVGSDDGDVGELERDVTKGKGSGKGSGKGPGKGSGKGSGSGKRTSSQGKTTKATGKTTKVVAAGKATKVAAAGKTTTTTRTTRKTRGTGRVTDT